MRDPVSIAKIFYFIVIGAVLAVIIFVDHDIAITIKADIKYSDLIATVLTALAVILAALAVFWVHWRYLVGAILAVECALTSKSIWPNF